MRKLLCALCALLITACATTETIDTTTLTPTQLAARVCPPVQAVLGVLAIPGAADPKVAASLAVVTPVVNAACAAGADTQLADIRTLAAQAVPAILQIIQAAPIDDRDKQTALLTLAVVQAVLAPVLQQAELAHEKPAEAG